MCTGNEKSPYICIAYFRAFSSIIVKSVVPHAQRLNII